MTRTKSSNSKFESRMCFCERPNFVNTFANTASPEIIKHIHTAMSTRGPWWLGVTRGPGFKDAMFEFLWTKAMMFVVGDLRKQCIDASSRWHRGMNVGSILVTKACDGTASLPRRHPGLVNLAPVRGICVLPCRLMWQQLGAGIRCCTSQATNPEAASHVVGLVRFLYIGI